MSVMDRIVLIFLLIFNLTLTSAIPKCCTNESLINSKKQCSDNKNISLTCDKRFILFKENNETALSIDDEDNLVMDQIDYISPDSYCYGKIAKSHREVYLVCYEPDTFEDFKRIIISILQLISVFFFLWTVAIYLSLPVMMDLQGICTVHSIVGLMVAYTDLVTINFSPYLNTFECHLVAYVMYAAFLYAFFWLNILCFHMWRNAVKPHFLEGIQKWKLIYYIYGIGCPVIALVIVAVIHHWNFDELQHVHPGIAEKRCWFKTSRETWIYFYSIVTVLLICNIVFFILTAIVLWKQLKVCRRTKILRYRWRLYIKLFFVMGISWIFEVLSATAEYHRSNVKYLWLITDSLNSLQGVIIFLILVVLRKKVVRALANTKFISTRFHLPTKWKYLEDSECEELEEEEQEIEDPVDRPSSMKFIDTKE